MKLLKLWRSGEGWWINSQNDFCLTYTQEEIAAKWVQYAVPKLNILPRLCILQ